MVGARISGCDGGRHKPYSPYRRDGNSAAKAGRRGGRGQARKTKSSGMGICPRNPLPPVPPP